MKFPLEQWFDVSKFISQADRKLTEAQILLYAVKEGTDPEGNEVMRCLKALKRDVRLHNKKYDESH